MVRTGGLFACCLTQHRGLDNMLFKGFRFGLLLQFAIGPICLFVFSTASSLGFAASLLASLAVTLVDGVYILLAGLGLAVFMQNTRVKNTVQFFGAIVLLFFGLDIALGFFGISYFPDIHLFREAEGEGVFLKATVMTASNPLTIIFWGGVLSATVASENITAKRLLLFGLGCVCATFTFLQVVGLIGILMGTFLPQIFMKVLNLCVGAVIMYFGFRMLRRDN